MEGLDIFNIVAGIITILSFLFAVWIWMKSDMRIRELSGIVETIYDIAGTALWESQVRIIEDDEIRIRQAEKTLGFIESIRKVSGRYITQKIRISGGSAIDQLVERDIVVTIATVMNMEQTKEVTEIWIVTPDLKPDASNESVGKIVNNNIKNSKKYVYFYPEYLPQAEIEMARLYRNIGIRGSRTEKLKDRVRLIPLTSEKFDQIFSGGNIGLYFFDTQRSLPPRCFEEVSFTQVPERAAFWQEHSENKSKEFRHLLESELQESLSQKTG